MTLFLRVQMLMLGFLIGSASFAYSQESQVKATNKSEVMASPTRKPLRSMLEGTTEHVVHCLDGTAQSQSTLEDGYKVMRTLDALSQSAKSGSKKITI